MDNLKVAILGSTGYTGIELLKILDNHPKATIKFLGANRNIKLKAQRLFSGLKNSINVSIRNNYDIKNYKDIDVVFSCSRKVSYPKILVNLSSKKINV